MKISHMVTEASFQGLPTPLQKVGAQARWDPAALLGVWGRCSWPLQAGRARDVGRLGRKEMHLPGDKLRPREGGGLAAGGLGGFRMRGDGQDRKGNLSGE